MVAALNGIAASVTAAPGLMYYVRLLSRVLNGRVNIMGIMCTAMLLVVGAVGADDVAAGAADPIPLVDIGILDDLIEDEAKVVDALREFDRSQQALAEWDIELADAHARKLEGELAQEKRKQA